ncbi:hypothetical protein ZIOFF_017167 [Zingiber officinale]|uniref:GH16 domain-containing protein n=1 Tax=Zingiber officinale TaxID=94328 RepID=A0A8J5HBC1_ZINOF|nr:hypothetical protein ZIOFF_017167 [Zingiber officinale]
MLPPHEASFLSEFPNLATISFEEGYTQLFGDSNLMLHGDSWTVHLSLDQRIGVAFASQDLYLHGFFSASIKMPSDYVAGVVVAFYSLLHRDGLCNGPRITLQWGCRKCLRRIKVRDKGSVAKSGVWRGIASRNVRRIADQESPLHPPLYPLWRSESAGSENHNSRSVSSSPDKDDRCYTTRGSAALVCEGEPRRKSLGSLSTSFLRFAVEQGEGGGLHGDEGVQAAATTQEEIQIHPKMHTLGESWSMAVRSLTGEVCSQGEEGIKKEEKRIKGHVHGE